MTMVKRVAQALVERRGFGWYDDPIEGGQDAFDICCEALDEARIAIDAMREPTENMLEAPKSDPNVCDFNPAPEEIWRSMIDAALRKA